VPRPTNQKSVKGAPILQPSPPPTRPQTQVVQAPTPSKSSIPGAAQPTPPAPTAAQQSPPAPHAAPAPLRAPTTAVVDKSLWIYVSNAQLPGRRRGWQASNTSWRNQLVSELGMPHLPVNLKNFNRVSPMTSDPRMILEAPTPMDRRELFMAIRHSQTHLRAHLHLTPQGKANKTLVYFTARRYPVTIQDRGDIVCVHWMSEPTLSARVELTRTAAEVEITLRNFLDARPRATRPTGNANADHRQRWR
jgi:hypothetical protein